MKPVAALEIRAALESDGAELARLCSELGYPVSQDTIGGRLRDVLSSGHDRLFVALSGSELVGWMQMHAAHVLESGFRVEIVGLVVTGSARRRGAGRALVSAGERWAESLGAAAVVVRSRVDRLESHHFYPALGYVHTKTQHVYRKRLQDETS